EPEIARPFGKRCQDLVGFGGNADLDHAWHLLCPVDAVHAAVDPGARDRNHHDARGGGLAAPEVDGFPDSVSEKKLLESGRFPARTLEAQGARTESADRARGDFEYVHAVAVDAAFRVHGAVAQSKGRRGCRDRLTNRALLVVRRAGWRHVDALLEERSVQRIGLVEDGEGVQPPVLQHALDRELAAGYEPFDEKVFR